MGENICDLEFFNRIWQPLKADICIFFGLKGTCFSYSHQALYCAGKNMKQTTEKLAKYFEDYAPSVSLFDEFCCGHTSLNDAECSGSRIRSLGRKIGKINDWLLNKRRLKIREIANTKGIHTEKWLRFWMFTLVIVIYSQNGCLFSSEVTR